MFNGVTKAILLKSRGHPSTLSGKPLFFCYQSFFIIGMSDGVNKRRGCEVVGLTWGRQCENVGEAVVGGVGGAKCTGGNNYSKLTISLTLYLERNRAGLLVIYTVYSYT